MIPFSLFWGAVARAQGQSDQQLQMLSKTFRDVAKDVSPAVVFISTEQTIEGGTNPHSELFSDEFFRRFFGVPEPRKEFKRRGLGSGFIVNDDGYILTNTHVVEKADKIQVTLPDKREFDASMVGIDPNSDVAVIKIDGNNLPVVTLGDSKMVEVGEWVVAIGNPYGLPQTVTAGIISAEGRANIGIVDYEDFIQTDAAINPGNSGGPLINIFGEVIGINTAIFSRSGGYQGIGFAIPINMAKRVMESLITKGRVIRGWLGVIIQPVTEEIAESFGLKDATGVLISDVVNGGPAEKAGIQRGDVIMSFDGKEVDDPNTLKNVVAQTDVGKTVPVEVIRDGQAQTIQVTIGEREAEMQANAGETSPSQSAKFGLHVQELTPEIASQLGYTGEEGVVVARVDPGSPAAEAGLRRGDLIQEIDRQPIQSLSHYNQALASRGKDKSGLVLIRRGQNTLYVVVKAE
jgi:serine protease Do